MQLIRRPHLLRPQQVASEVGAVLDLIAQASAVVGILAQIQECRGPAR